MTRQAKNMKKSKDMHVKANLPILVCSFADR